MSLPVVIDQSPDPEGPGQGRDTAPSIAAWVRAMGPSRTGALLLVAGTVLAIVWANVSHETYEAFWDTRMTIGVADLNLDFTLHALVNDALMAVFFFTVGLEVRREFSIGELTTWNRAVVPVVAAVCGLLVPSLLYVLIARGSGWESAWGVVISTDTAFLVGGLALVGPRASGRLRVFLLALAVVDDIGALSIIALVYTENFNPQPLLIAAAGLVGIWFTRYVPTGRGPIYASLSIIVWFAFLASGVHPTLAGVAIALLVPVYRPSRREVEHALALARTFRQSPTTQYARAAANSLRESISINERLQSAYAPYVSFVILPVFALANAGVQISTEVLAAAAGSPVTWGIVTALVVGKFVGVLGSTTLVRVLRLGELGPGLTSSRLAGGAALCGVGFTLSLTSSTSRSPTPERSPRELEVGQVLQRPVDPRCRTRRASVCCWPRCSPSDLTSPAVAATSGGTHPWCTTTRMPLPRPILDQRQRRIDGDFQCGFCLTGP